MGAKIYDYQSISISTVVYGSNKGLMKNCHHYRSVGYTLILCEGQWVEILRDKLYTSCNREAGHQT